MTSFRVESAAAEPPHRAHDRHRSVDPPGRPRHFRSLLYGVSGQNGIALWRASSIRVNRVGVLKVAWSTKPGRTQEEASRVSRASVQPSRARPRPLKPAQRPVVRDLAVAVGTPTAGGKARRPPGATASGAVRSR